MPANESAPLQLFRRKAPVPFPNHEPGVGLSQRKFKIKPGMDKDAIAGGKNPRHIGHELQVTLRDLVQRPCPGLPDSYPGQVAKPEIAGGPIAYRFQRQVFVVAKQRPDVIVGMAKGQQVIQHPFAVRTRDRGNRPAAKGYPLAPNAGRLRSRRARSCCTMDVAHGVAAAGTGLAMRPAQAVARFSCRSFMRLPLSVFTVSPQVSAKAVAVSGCRSCGPRCPPKRHPSPSCRGFLKR